MRLVTSPFWPETPGQLRVAVLPVFGSGLSFRKEADPVTEPAIEDHAFIGDTGLARCVARAGRFWSSPSSTRAQPDHSIDTKLDLTCRPVEGLASASSLVRPPRA